MLRLLAAVVCLLGIVGVPAAAYPTQYSIREIPSPGFGPQAISSDGRVAGFYYDHAFVWDDENGTRDLGVPQGCYMSRATGVNASGVVVGVGYVSPASYSTRAFVWDGQMRRLGEADEDSSYAFAVNDKGEIAGQHDGQPCVWADGVRYDLELPSGYIGGTGRGIDDDGRVVGEAWDADNRRHVFRWGNGAGTDLGVLELSSGTLVLDCNTSGVAVGQSDYFSPWPWCIRAFAWENGNVRELPMLLGDDESSALAINSAGLIVGRSFRSADVPVLYYRACLWQDDQIVDLNSLIPSGSGWALEEAAAINDRGQIAGWGTLDGQLQAFVLTPVPEPASIFALLCGLGGLLFHVRNSANRN